MNIPFQIMLPKFRIENRDIHLSFSIMGKVGIPRVTMVIDHWKIIDQKGRGVRGIPTGENRYITMNQYGKKIDLVMKDAGVQLSYDCLDICIHFLTQNSQSIEAHYSYKIIGNRFGFSRIDETPTKKSNG